MSENIRQLQDTFKEYLYSGANEEQLMACVAERNNIPTQQRLDVYRNAYYIRLQETIAHDYPTLLTVAGDEHFGDLITSYIRAYPSTSASLREFGKSLPQWLKTRNEFALADIAALEWAVLDAFDAANAEPLRAETLAQVPPTKWQELTFLFHPSVSLLSVGCNARDCWSAVRNDEASIPEFHTTEQEYLVVWRAVKGPAVRSVDATTYQVLSSLKQGLRFGDTCLDLSHTVDDQHAAELAATVLALASQAGWIVAMENYSEV